MSQVKKVALITGVTGQDGAYLAELLLNKGYEVHGIKRRSSLFNTARIDHLFHDVHEKGKPFFLHHGDMTDSSSLTRIIQKVQPDRAMSQFRLKSLNILPIQMPSAHYVFWKLSVFWGWKRRRVFIRLLPPNFTVWCRKHRKRKPHHSTRAVRMQ
jgi:hypothetical protein